MVEVIVADVAHAADVFQEEEGFGLNYAIVVLLDEVGRRLLPIWVGIHEGELIALSVLENLTPRPLTFAFMGKLLEGAGVALESVRVEALKEDTFYAIARVRNGDVVQEIDARPSDAIPLALQMKRPIYVSEAVMEEAGIDISDQDGLPVGTGIKLMEKRMTEAWEGSKEKVEKALAQTSREEIKRQIGQGLVGFLLGSEG
jgi:bifunctional DNase/RNase